MFDATTDAQVLKSMLAREGLTKEMELSGGEEMRMELTGAGEKRDGKGTDQDGRTE